MNEKAIFKLSYGLYVLTAKDGDKTNGCIINTAVQQTSSPLQVSITVNKQNYTHDMILKTRRCGVSALSTSAPFELIKHFGFQSGRTTEKFVNFPHNETPDGLPYLAYCSNAYLICEVTQTIDLGTHTMFIATVTDCDILSDEESMTYAYYHQNVKPAPPKAAEKTKGWRCTICGYVHEEEELPADFICPICKHGVSDFEKVQ